MARRKNNRNDVSEADAMTVSRNVRQSLWSASLSGQSGDGFALRPMFRAAISRSPRFALSHRSPTRVVLVLLSTLDGVHASERRRRAEIRASGPVISDKVDAERQESNWNGTVAKLRIADRYRKIRKTRFYQTSPIGFGDYAPVRVVTSRDPAAGHPLLGILSKLEIEDVEPLKACLLHSSNRRNRTKSPALVKTASGSASRGRRPEKIDDTGGF